MLTPELFPRADGTTYVCAISSETRCRPIRPRSRRPRRDRAAGSAVRDVSPAFARRRSLARQACYRPVARDGLPLIGRVPGLAGAYVATGHSVWGMLNAPATGEAMAELIVDGGARTFDLRRSIRPACGRSIRRPCASARMALHRAGPSAYAGFIGGSTSAGSSPSSYRPML